MPHSVKHTMQHRQYFIHHCD